MESGINHCDSEVEQKFVSSADKLHMKTQSSIKHAHENDVIVQGKDDNEQSNNKISEEDNSVKSNENRVTIEIEQSNILPKDIDLRQENTTEMATDQSTAINVIATHGKMQDSINLRNPKLSKITEGEISNNKHTSLPVNNQNIEIDRPSERRLTEPSIKTTKSDRNKLKSIDCTKNMEITRVVSSERQSSRSGFGGTADFHGKKPSVTATERLKAEMESGNKPHPLIILPDDGKFWCDPPDKQVSAQKYYLSCFEMKEQEKYTDLSNVIVNPIEVAADAYKNHFSQVKHYF